jgi:hypothetical protein
MTPTSGATAPDASYQAETACRQQSPRSVRVLDFLDSSWSGQTSSAQETATVPGNASKSLTGAEVEKVSRYVAKEVRVGTGGSVDGLATRVPSRRHKRWHKVLIALAAVFLVFCAGTARLFVWPVQGMASRVDAIVMLDGPGEVLNVAERLATQHRVPFLVISQGTPASGDPCPRPLPGVTLICFHPSPATTQGEAEFVAGLARKYHWQSMAVVAITPQVSRAWLRVERCFAGHVYMVAAPVRLSSWPYQIAYEWAALAKAVFTQRGC